MLLDSNLLFWHTGTAYGYTAGEFVSLVGTTSSSTSTVINLGNARDLGIGDVGPGGNPKIFCMVGTAITSSSGSMLINATFDGSTNSVLWTTYAQSANLSTASYAAGSLVLPIDVPRRPTGAGLPLYYRMTINVTGAAGAGISTGTIIGGIVLDRGDVDTFGAYPSGFTFPSAG